MSCKKRTTFFILLVQFLFIFTELTRKAQASVISNSISSVKEGSKKLLNPVEIGKGIIPEKFPGKGIIPEKFPGIGIIPEKFPGIGIIPEKFPGSIQNPWEAIKNATGKLPNPFEDPEGIFGKIPESINDPLGTIKNLTGNIPSLNDIESGINDLIPDPTEIVEHLNELVETTATFVKNNVTLNCFGVPIALFANVIEKIFTQTTKAQDVRFYFFSRNNLNNVTVHVDQKFTLEDISFDIRRPTVLIVHGFMSSGRETWLSEMKDALLKLADVNVILVDWQKGSNTWNYYSAAISTRIVGLQIAKLFAQIRQQVRNSSSSPKVSEWGSVHFVGHSLGAHISGHASFLIRESQRAMEDRWIVNRITGLDPAQPCFTTANLTLKLDNTDAPYVDIIHTNAKNLFLLGLGLPEQLGYVDFYPNGGAVQPGCFDIDLSIWGFMMLPKEIIQESVCSHGRSYAFFTESVTNAAAKNCSFIGYTWDRKSKPVEVTKELCTNGRCTEMGVHSIRHYPDNKGVFYVPTRETHPFCDRKLKL